MLAKYAYKKDFNTYQIFLPDVDGLINGSPVRLMGIQIGYVNQIDIVGEDVYVRFTITEKGVKLPRGSVATVEFTGLGGSKSLEIYPPEIHSQIPPEDVLIAQNPKRIHDSLGLLNEMYKQVVDITYTVSSFMHSIGLIRAEQKISIKGEYKAQEIIDISNEWIDRAQKQCENCKKNLDKANWRKKSEQCECKTD